MGIYKLKENENVIFRGSAMFFSDYKRAEENAKSCDVMLTNLNIVITYQKKKLFRTVTKSSVFKTEDVKIYDDTIQIIRQAADVDIYFKKSEVYLTFEEEIAKDFSDKALTLISGNSKFVRAIKKAQKVVNEKIIDGVTEVTKTAKVAKNVVETVISSTKEIFTSENDDTSNSR